MTRARPNTLAKNPGWCPAHRPSARSATGSTGIRTAPPPPKTRTSPPPNAPASQARSPRQSRDDRPSAKLQQRTGSGPTAPPPRSPAPPSSRAADRKSGPGESVDDLGMDRTRPQSALRAAVVRRSNSPMRTTNRTSTNPPADPRRDVGVDPIGRRGCRPPASPARGGSRVKWYAKSCRRLQRITPGAPSRIRNRRRVPPDTSPDARECSRMWPPAPWATTQHLEPTATGSSTPPISLTIGAAAGHAIGGRPKPDGAKPAGHGGQLRQVADGAEKKSGSACRDLPGSTATPARASRHGAVRLRRQG